MRVGVRKRTEQTVYVGRQGHVDRNTGLGAIEKQVSIIADPLPLQRHRILDRKPRPSHQENQCPQAVLAMLKVMTATPVAVGVGCIYQSAELLFGEVVGGNSFYPNPFEKGGRIFGDPIHAHAEPEKCDQPLVLALRGLRGVTPACAKLGEISGR